MLARRNWKEMEKLNEQLDVRMKSKWMQLLMVCFAACLMAANIKIMVRNGGLYPGGATGLSILIQRSVQMFFGLELPYSLINLSLNAIPLVIAFLYISRKFAIYTIVMVVLTSFLTDLIPVYTLTEDTLLISIFGGLINGTVISLCLRAGATSGGTDILSIYRSKKTGKDSWNLILGLNICILLAAGILFGLDKAMYSIIFQFVSTQVVHLLYKKYSKETLLVVTDYPQEICEVIKLVSSHGATILTGEGAYAHTSKFMVYSVVSGAEASTVIRSIRKTDGKAFINRMRTEELVGRFRYVED